MGGGCFAPLTPLPLRNLAGKGSPKAASSPLPNLLVPFYVTLHSVCEAEGGGDGSRRAESSILKQKDR